MQNGFGTMISNEKFMLLFGIFLVKKGVSKYLQIASIDLFHFLVLLKSWWNFLERIGVGFEIKK